MKADFTAEHEWGIEDLKNKLGVNGTKLGIKGRIINDAKSLYLLHGSKGAYLCVPAYFHPESERLDKETEIHGWKENALSSAWSDKDFYIYAQTHEDIALLQELYDQARKKNVAIGLGGSDPRNPFDRAGLSIVLVSRMSKDVLQSIYDEDLDYKNLQKADKKTKLGAILDAKYKGQWKRPRIRAAWAKDHRAMRGDEPIESTTKYPVVYWLNADRYYGWYTVEEIRQWLNTGSGIIEDEKHAKV